MLVNHVYLLPIIIFVWFPATFVVTYIIAVLNKDVNPLFPYISDTGTFSPESCIFGQMLNMGAIFMALLVYVRHRQVRETCDKHLLKETVRKRDRISAWFGYLAAFGVTIVGNFQETNVFFVHIFGAFLAFGLGTVWECLQTWVSFQTYPFIGSRNVIKMRLILSSACSVSFAISLLFAGLALLKFNGKDVTKWTKKDGGYEFHITSTITEWIVVFLTMVFILSYASELRNVKFDEPNVKIVETKTLSHTANTIAISETAQTSRVNVSEMY